MKINLKETIKNIKGEPLKVEDRELTLGEVLSNILLSSETGGKMKCFILAKECYDQKEVDVDASDFALIKKEVSASKIYSGSLVIGQAELFLNEIKE